MKKFTGFLRDGSGATAIEYALIAAFMDGMLILAMPYIANAVSDLRRIIPRPTPSPPNTQCGHGQAAASALEQMGEPT